MRNLSKEFEQKTGVRLKQVSKKAISWVCVIAMIVSIFAILPPRDAYASATTFTIRYNANGGTGTMANTIVTYGVTTNTRTNTFIRIGYDFDGWFIQRSSDNRWRYRSADETQSGWYAEGSQPSGWSKWRYTNGGSLATTVSAGDTVTFYAQWKVSTTFRIKYSGNGGTGTMSDTVVTHGVTTNTRSNTFIRIGYDFDCWFIQRASDNRWRYRSADGVSSGWYAEGSQPSGWSKYRYSSGTTVSATVSIGDIVTFHAQWKVSTTFRIKYNANGGTGTMADTVVTHGVTTNSRTNTFVRIGYDFNGWFIQRASDNRWRYRSADETQSGWYDEGSQPSGWSKWRYTNGGTLATTVSIGNIVTFHAQWKVSTTFRIKYNANGGTGTKLDTVVTHGVTTNTRSNTFIRSGYDFDCWFIQRASDNKWRYRSADGVNSGWYTEGSQPSGWAKYRYSNGTTVSATVSIGDIVTFYAQWNVATAFTIKYHANGGSGTMADQKVTYGVNTVTRSNTFVRTGYEFDCWFVQRSTDNKWRYRSPDGTETGFYTKGSQPSGWTEYRYTNGITVSATVSAGNFAHYYAQWKPAANSLTLNRNTAQLDEGDTVTIAGTVLPTTANKTLTWTTSNANVATVSSSGVVTALRKGNAVITARTTNGLTATCTITVSGQTTRRYYGLGGVHSPIGNYSVTSNDIEVHTVMGKISLSHTYNSLEAAMPSMIGKGFTFNYDMKVDFRENKAIVTMSDSAQWQFNKISNGKYVAADNRGILESEQGGFILKTLDMTQYGFDSNGLLKYVRDFDGNQLNIVRDIDRKIIKISDKSGTDIEFIYADLLLTEIRDKSSEETVEYTYNANGNLIKVIYPDGLEKHYAYNTQGLLSSITDSAENSEGEKLQQKEMELTYYTSGTYNGMVHKMTDSIGIITEYIYDFAKQKSTIKDAALEIEETYNGFFAIISVKDLKNSLTTESTNYPSNSTVDDPDRPESTTDEYGNTTKYEYDANGNLTRIIYPDGSTERSTYDLKNNNVLSIRCGYMVYL